MFPQIPHLFTFLVSTPSWTCSCSLCGVAAPLTWDLVISSLKKCCDFLKNAVISEHGRSAVAHVNADANADL